MYYHIHHIYHCHTFEIRLWNPRRVVPRSPPRRCRSSLQPPPGLGHGGHGGHWRIPNGAAMVCHGSHQYTPVMLADIPAPWILWDIDINLININQYKSGFDPFYAIFTCFLFASRKWEETRELGQTVTLFMISWRKNRRQTWKSYGRRPFILSKLCGKNQTWLAGKYPRNGGL